MKQALLFELKRQAFHFFFGTLFAALFFFDLIDAYGILGILVMGVIWSLLFRHQDIPGIGWILRHFEREDIGYKGRGVITMLMGVFIAFLVFEKHIAIAAVLVLAWGDSFSTLFGKWLGKTRFPWSTKTLEGSFFGWLGAFAGMLLFFPLVVSLIASIVTMFVESFDLHRWRLDDNIILPVVGGLLLFFLLLL